MGLEDPGGTVPADPHLLSPPAGKLDPVHLAVGLGVLACLWGLLGTLWIRLFLLLAPGPLVIWAIRDRIPVAASLGTFVIAFVLAIPLLGSGFLPVAWAGLPFVAGGLFLARRPAAASLVLVHFYLGFAIVVGGAWAFRHSHPGFGSEGSAIGSLRTLSTAQDEFRQGACVDQDGDRQGEYGFLQELAGTAIPRSGKALVTPAYISRVFGESAAQNDGLAEKSGYHFLVYLPTARGQHAPGARREQVPLPPPARADAAAQKLRYVIYAWPVEYGVTGTRVFAVNQQAEVFVAPNTETRYSGRKRAPRPEAAYDATDAGARSLNARMGGSRCHDGQTWKPAGG